MSVSDQSESTDLVQSKRRGGVGWRGWGEREREREKEEEEERERGRERDGERQRQRETQREIRMIYSFRPVPLISIENVSEDEY